MTLTIDYIPFENILRNNGPGIWLLLQLRLGHNQTSNAASTRYI